MITGRCRIVLLLLTLSAASARAAIVNTTWTGAGDGVNWGDSANWSAGSVPNNGADNYNVTINAGATVTVNGAFAIDSLTLASGGTLIIPAGGTLTLNAASTVDGLLRLNDTDASLANRAVLRAGTSLTISGSGTIRFDTANFQNVIEAPSDSDVLTLGSSLQVVTASGATGRTTSITIANQGSISAAAGEIIFDAPLNNSGTVSATSSGTIRIGPAGLTDNTGGTISIDGTSTLELASSIDGGTIDGAGTVDVDGSAGLSDLTLDSIVVVVEAAETLTLLGTIVNGGTIRLSDADASLANRALLGISGTVNLDGDGFLEFTTTNFQNAVDDSGGSDLLVIGSGQTARTTGGGIGRFALPVENHGSILADAGGQITFDDLLTNASQISATNGSLLALGISAATTNTGGTFSLDATSTLSLATSITGGTIDGAGTVDVASSGSLVTLTLDGVVAEVEAAETLTLMGTITNDGTIRLADADPSLANRALLAIAGTVNLDGGGFLEFATTNFQNAVDDAGGSDLLVIGSAQTARTVSGGIGRFVVPVDNQGTIEAASGGSIVFDDLLTNQNQISATGGSTIRLGFSAATTNAGGTISVDGTSTLELATSITGGTIDGAGTVDIDGSGGLVDLTLGGTLVVEVEAGEALALLGTITNNATIRLADADPSAGNTATVTVTGPVTIDGDGELQFSTANFQNLVAPAVAGDTLTIGAGQSVTTPGGASGRFTLAVVNLGTIDASGAGTIVFDEDLGNGGTVLIPAGGTVRIGPSATLDNDGTVTGEGTLDVAGTFTNDGLIEPGIAIGTLSVTGDMTQSSAGTLHVEIGSGGNDLLAVSGTATLGGTLTASLVGGFSPPPGSSFTIVTGTISGEFENAPNGSQITFDGFTATVVYTSSAVILQNIQVQAVAEIPTLDPRALVVLALALALALVRRV